MKKFTILLILQFLFSNLFPQGYEINLKINNLNDTIAIIGHHFGSSLFTDDTITLDSQGRGIFKGKEALPGGMYFIFLPNKTYFDILIDEDQFFSIENDTSDFVNNCKITGSIENKLFYDYQKYMVEKRKISTDLRERKKEEQNDKEKEKIDKKLKQLNEEVISYIESVIAGNPNTFFAGFVKATNEIKIPDAPVDEEGNITDSLFKYRYYKQHFFDNFDITDVRLLRTPIYKNKIMQYLEKVIPPIPDSIIFHVDMLIEKSRRNDVLFRFMLVTLFNHYASSKIIGMDAVLVHIAEKYYIPEATWSDSEYIDKLKTHVSEIKPLLIGKIAPDIKMVEVPDEHFIQAENDSIKRKNVYVGSFVNLYDIKAKYTIVYFWEADCGHCKKVTPELHKLYEKMNDSGLEVMSVHMLSGIEGKVKWVNFVNKLKLYGWKNVWNPYDFSYKNKFNIKSSNILYLLDEDKKIITKLINPEQAEEILKLLLKEE